MDRFFAYFGGLLGGWALLETPVEGSVLAGIGPILDLLGTITLIVFSAALIYRGVRVLIGK